MSTARRVFTFGARSLRSKCTLDVERWRCSAPGVSVETCLSLPPTLSLPREGGGDLEFQCRALGFLEATFGNVHKSQHRRWQSIYLPHLRHTPLARKIHELGGT